MVFSSVTFLFLFLPISLALYALSPAALRNYTLLCISLVFYWWGSVDQFWLIAVSVLGNYLCGLWIAEAKEQGFSAKSQLVIASAFNLGLLFYFKYNNFFFDSLNSLLAIGGAEAVTFAKVVLPIGISFFTFQAFSYIIDLYRGQVAVQRNPFYLALYIVLFPQLIAGPIVRYSDVEAQIVSRVTSAERFLSGIERFILGLGKKVIIANGLAEVADQIFSASPGSISSGAAWLGVLCYFFQIYFDFSGYSDMAIGLGRMFGFTFLENFQFPYAAKSIKEFWRRWHISLSTWFRDYLYIPLGGNQGTRFRTAVNLLIVFFLCGLWHGASWNFVVWGLLHGAFLSLERTKFGSMLERLPSLVKLAYVWLVVLIAWVFFRAEDLPGALGYLAAMFTSSGAQEISVTALQFLNAEVVFLLFLATLFSFPVYRTLKLGRAISFTRFIYALSLVVVFIYSISRLASQSYNPFIYFRF